MLVAPMITDLIDAIAIIAAAVICGAIIGICGTTIHYSHKDDHQ